MSDSSDTELLEQFVRNKSEAAFAELVERHIGLVYSTAFRRTGNPQQSEDITQAVFIILARKAHSLGPKTVLPGWMHHTARLTAANLQRAELRRMRREQEAFMQSAINESAPDALWREVSPLLDDAVSALGTSDRDAIVLRFFQNRSMGEVAARLGASEDAARMRVNRALEKMRKFYARRGMTISSTAISGTISANSVQGAPTGLGAIISANALSGTTLTTAAVVAATKAIAMTTFQKAVVTAALAVTVGAGIFEAHQNSESQKQIQNLRQQQSSLNDQFAQLQRERDDATNQLDDLLAENAQLRSNSNQQELLKLRGEVTAAARAAADAAAKPRNPRNNPESSQAEADNQRNQARAHLDQFFKLTNLSPEKADQYVDLEVEMKRRQNERMKGLLSGTLSVAEAVRQRDQDIQQQQDQRREILGPDGWATLQSIADGMRNGVANSLMGAVQANMGDNSLTQQQSDRLQGLIKAEVVANTMDDTDLFRPVNEWTQMVTDHQQHVLQAASQFLTPAQQETLQFLEKANLAQLLQQREQRIKALGINQ
jgi:RNA polymerase sigma factor (sigma-70 family)